MALIKCYECEKQVSTDASFCPNCGAPPIASDAKKTVTENIAEQLSEINSQESVKTKSSSDPDAPKVSENHDKDNEEFIGHFSQFKAEVMTALGQLKGWWKGLQSRDQWFFVE